MRSISKSLSFKSKAKNASQPHIIAAGTSISHPVSGDCTLHDGPPPTPQTPVAASTIAEETPASSNSASTERPTLLNSASISPDYHSLRCPEGGEAPWLSKEQHFLISEMRVVIAKLYNDPVPSFIELTGDLRLLRFLEGYGSDVGVASENYVGMLTWRARSGMDTIRHRLVAAWDNDLHMYSETSLPFKNTVLEHLPLQLNFAYSEPDAATLATGKHAGHLVTIEYTGLSDPGVLLEKLTLEQYIEFEKHNMEHKAILLDRLSRELGFLVKIISVRDMSGMGYKHAGGKSVTIMTSVLKMMQGAYPEVIENIFIVNAPWIFATLWGLVKPFVAPRTIEKIKIFGSSNEKGAKELLVARIGAHNLPERYGGSRKDGSCLPSKVLEAAGVTVPPDHDSLLQGPKPPFDSTKAAGSFNSLVSAGKSSAAAAADVDADADAAVVASLPTPPPLAAGFSQEGALMGEDETAAAKTLKDWAGSGGGSGGSYEDDFGMNPLSMAASASLDAEIAKIAAEKEGGDAYPRLPESPLLSTNKVDTREGCRLAEVMESTFDVPPGVKHEIFLDIDSDESNAAEDELNSSVIVTWSFDIISFLATTDVGFSVRFVESTASNSGILASDDEATLEGSVIKSLERVSCDATSPQRGEWKTSGRSGTLVIQWDNTYSLFMAKELHYRIEVWEQSASTVRGGASAAELRRVECRSITSVKKESFDDITLELPSMFSWVSTDGPEDDDITVLPADEKLKEGSFWDSIDISLPDVLKTDATLSEATQAKKNGENGPSFWDRATFQKST